MGGSLVRGTPVPELGGEPVLHFHLCVAEGTDHWIGRLHVALAVKKYVQLLIDIAMTLDNQQSGTFDRSDYTKTYDLYIISPIHVIQTGS